MCFFLKKKLMVLNDMECGDGLLFVCLMVRLVVNSLFGNWVVVGVIL